MQRTGFILPLKWWTFSRFYSKGRVVILVTVKFKLDDTWDEYKDINKEFLLEDMVDKMQTLKAGIEPVEIVDIETEKQL